MVDLQDVLHAGDERGVGLRRDDPLLLQVRLESVFLSVRRRSCCRWRDRRCSAPRRRFPAASASTACVLFRRRRAGERDQLGLGGTSSKMRFLAELGECLRVRAASTPPSTSRWRSVRAMMSMLVSRRCGEPAIAPGFAGLRGIGLQQDACLQHLPCRTRALLYQRVEALPLVSAERYDVSLYGRLFRDHDASPGNRRYQFRHRPQNQRRGALITGIRVQ